jgi:heme exporter protein D
MYFDSFSEFLAMGDHGLYVWMAYAAFLILIIWNLVTPQLRRRRVLDSVGRYWRREQEANPTAASLDNEEPPLPFAEQDS